MALAEFRSQTRDFETWFEELQKGSIVMFSDKSDIRSHQLERQPSTGVSLDLLSVNGSVSMCKKAGLVFLTNWKDDMTSLVQVPKGNDYQQWDVVRHSLL